MIICFTYLVFISHTVLFHITCVYSLPEYDSSLLYPLRVSLESVLIEGCSQVCKTRLLASSQIGNSAIFTAFISRYLLLPPGLLPLAHTLPCANTYTVLYDSVVPMLYNLMCYMHAALPLLYDLSIQHLSQLSTASLCLLPTPQALLLLPFLLLLLNLALNC